MKSSEDNPSLARMYTGSCLWAQRRRYTACNLVKVIQGFKVCLLLQYRVCVYYCRTYCITAMQ